MAKDLYKKVEDFVVNTFTKINDENGVKHLLGTVEWVKFLNPLADEALRIAAVAHDIERGFRDHKNYNFIKDSNDGFKSDNHLTHHQEQGAKIIAEFLEELNADEELVDRVKMLVLKHEVGGNEDQNLLKDADSLSFFENNIDHFIDKKIADTSKDKVKDKFDWMFNRISSDRAKKIAQPFYEEALKKLAFK